MAVSLGPNGLQLNDATHDDFADFQGGGKILQVISSNNTYNHSIAGVSNVDYHMASSSGVAWFPEITISPYSKVLVHYAISTSTSSPDPFLLIKLQRSINGGGWANVLVGDTNGSRTRVYNGFRTRALDNYAQTPVHISYFHEPNQSSGVTIRYRLLFRQGASSTRITYFNYSTANASESGTFVSTCILQEVSQ